MNQLEKIIEVTGHPSTEDVEASNSKFAAPMLQSLPKYEKKNMASLMTAPPEAIDIVEKMLAFNPAKRLTVDSLSACLAALALRSAMSMLPSASQPMATMRMPHMAAEAGLVPCAETGMRQTSRAASPCAAW